MHSASYWMSPEDWARGWLKGSISATDIRDRFRSWDLACQVKCLRYLHKFGPGVRKSCEFERLEYEFAQNMIANQLLTRLESCDQIEEPEAETAMLVEAFYELPFENVRSLYSYNWYEQCTFCQCETEWTRVFCNAFARYFEELGE